tara:strand:- start:1315 stop:3504 length:2190 start_codon:yes stop_codon:yes gene_type:complete
MATPQLSPGILVREIDLTVGRVDNVINQIGGIAGPFQLGPVDEPIEVSNEAGFIETFGKPLSTDRQYEYWMSGSSYLSYGGVLKVVRTDGSTLRNANAGVGMANTTTLKVKNNDDYEENYQTSTNFTWVAKNPGTWANGLKVAIIDNAADQRLGISTVAFGDGSNLKVNVGTAVTASITGAIPGAGTTSAFDGYLKAIVTGVTTDSSGNDSSIDVKITARVSAAGTEYPIDYAKNDSTRAFSASDTLIFTNSSGITTGYSVSADTAVDWYDQQTLSLNTPIYWNSIAGKPVDSNFSSSRSGGGDSIHVVVVDDDGSVTGIQGNILEKHTFLSKAKDSTADGNAPTRNYYKDYLINGSQYIFAGYNPSIGEDAYHGTVPAATGFSTNFVPYTSGEGQWGQDAQGIQFAAVGNKTYTFGGGVDYTANKGYATTLGDLQTSYQLFANDADVEVDFLLMGPGLPTKVESQAKANQLISIAESRKDCIATISPHRGDVVGQTNTTTQMNNILEFYSPLSSSSYAVFDTGWKYVYDRFNNAFVYVPCNPDIAGTMVRTEITSFPWFSPAGVQRGAINDAIKLAYNPSKAQRDNLYGERINPIVNKPGAGIVLFGDKTALGYASAFDRINVRRLFLTVEQSIEAVANAQLFEINDSITRANFVNAIEPYLRDIQAKRGLYDFVIKCDENNNTPDIIDNNEFRADIFLKPTKSINYVTLTFVATRTGVDFQEVVGSV